MEDQVDLELGEDAVEELGVEDRADDLVPDLGGQLRRERVEVQGDDGALVALGEAGDEAVADLAGGTGDEDDRLA